MPTRVVPGTYRMLEWGPPNHLGGGSRVFDARGDQVRTAARVTEHGPSALRGTVLDLISPREVLVVWDGPTRDREILDPRSLVLVAG